MVDYEYVFEANGNHLFRLFGEYQHACTVAVNLERTLVRAGLNGEYEVAVPVDLLPVDSDSFRQLFDSRLGEFPELVLVFVQDEVSIYV